MDVEAESAGSVSKRQIVYRTLGYAELGRGHGDAARRWFRKSQEYPGGFSKATLYGAVRERIVNDPNWPPWLAEKK